jgi:hypothetical protein
MTSNRQLNLAGARHLLGMVAVLLVGIAMLVVLLSGCGKTIIAGGELHKMSDVGGISSIAEAKDGTVLLEWYKRDSYETYALPGKGWSHTYKLPGAILPIAQFNGRDDRLAVWVDNSGRLFFRRSPSRR